MFVELWKGNGLGSGPKRAGCNMIGAGRLTRYAYAVSIVAVVSSVVVRIRFDSRL